MTFCLIKKNSQYNLLTLISSSLVQPQRVWFLELDTRQELLWKRYQHLCSGKNKWGEETPTLCFNVWVVCVTFLYVILLLKLLRSRACRYARLLCCSHIPVAACCQGLMWHQSTCNRYIVKQFILGSETLLRIDSLSFQQERTNKLKWETREGKVGKIREGKVSKENQKGKKQQTGSGGVPDWSETHGGTIAQGSFQQTAVRWQAGDVT